MFSGVAIEWDWGDGFSQRWKQSDGDQQNGDGPKIEASKELFEGRKMAREEGCAVNSLGFLEETSQWGHEQFFMCARYFDTERD